MRHLTARFSSIIFFMTAEGVTGKTLSVSTTNFTSKVICSGTQAADNNAASPRNSLNNVISLKFSSSIMARASPSGIKKRPRQLVIKPEIVSPFGKRCISERFLIRIPFVRRSADYNKREFVLRLSSCPFCRSPLI